MQKYTSANTSINKNKIPALFTKVDKYFGWKIKEIVADFGCGKYPNIIQSFLEKKGIVYIPIDPYNQTREEQIKSSSMLEKYITSQGGIDVTCISNVLNTIKENVEKSYLIENAWRMLRYGGTIYITCYNSGKRGKSKSDSWQESKTLKSYLPLVRKNFPNAEIKYNMIIASKVSEAGNRTLH